ncbi:putative deoxyribonuclease YjjV [Candidatus Velamenicoccus archaeovorus]|uniref:Putative deoxyribonuclease YjjV n=1 Tax=Velamenicoccus archaeovorus TaxID=1930593 RepID=A0A410P707_VELA1|nr:TatD family hydrolase [Candidatus Velamenicoccus archaeovorus]QAT17987.1 putative deoxyribonuclease YjjV [Candidatus Velamenicoccus archaeovorus]
MIDLIDAHCHMQDERIKGDLRSLVSRAKDKGVHRLVCCGSEESDWEAVAALKEQYPCEIIPSFGLHPWYIKDRSAKWLENLEGFLKRMPSGVGEIGLDHGLKDFDEQDQREVFLAQLALARTYRRPVSIHCRRAWDVLLDVLKDFGPLDAGGVIHSYSGSAEMVPSLQIYGLYFSFSCSITRSGNTRGRRALQAVPRDRLLIETDSPDIPPAGLTGLNEPSHLLLVAQAVSEIIGVSMDDVAAMTSANATALFGSLA